MIRIQQNGSVLIRLESPFTSGSPMQAPPSQATQNQTYFGGTLTNLNDVLIPATANSSMKEGSLSFLLTAQAQERNIYLVPLEAESGIAKVAYVQICRPETCL